VYHHDDRTVAPIRSVTIAECGKRGFRDDAGELGWSVFERLDDAPVTAPEARVAAEGDLCRLITALHRDGALVERLPGDLHDAESALGALEVFKELEFDLVLEDLLYAAEEGAPLLAKRIQVATVRRETRRGIHDLLAKGVTIVAL
jgi:hypothetical protein